MQNQSLNIANWTANGLMHNKNELRAYLLTQNIDIAITTETHLRPSDRFKIPNYYTYRKDRKDRQGGGVALFIKKNIKHNPIPNTPENSEIESTGLQLEINKKK